VLWTAIPLLVVLVLAARSWVTVFDLQRAAAAAAVSAIVPSKGPSLR
jgi:heme/copper-type cytochrome/quinol oxidase subunit 2